MDPQNPDGSQDAGEASQKPEHVPTSSAPIDIPVLPSTSQPANSSPGVVGGPPLPPWVAGASPVKLFTLDELLQVHSTLEKMVIAHEMAIDPSFTLDKLPKDPLEAQVRKCMHDAFWDRVKEDFEKEPPDYSQAVPLIADLREMILGLLTEQQKNVRQLVESGLDLELIQQQMDKNVFDLKSLLAFVMDVLSKLCAPARDQAMVELRQQTDTISIIRGLFEFIELMKLDLANFTVSSNRSTIEKYAAEYERDQFLRILQIDPAGNAAVKLHLRRALHAAVAVTPAMTEQSELQSNQIRDMIAQFYMTLLEHPPSSESFPETLKMDEERIRALSEKFLQLVLVVAAIFVSGNLVGKQVCEEVNFKGAIKSDLIVLLNNVNKNNVGERIESIALQCVMLSEKLAGSRWSPEQAVAMKSQVLDLQDPQNPIRKIARDRLYGFMLSVIASLGAGPIQLPPGLSVVQQELCALTGRFLHLTSHNWRAFGTHYAQVLEEQFRRRRQ